jgi:lipoprotein-releasing system ATP-binding protein
MSEEAAVLASGVARHFIGGDGSRLEILSGVELRVERGERVAIIGESGAGKSTLLQLLGGLDRPTAGEVRVGGRAIGGMDEAALASLRNREIGFVFQFHHLLREFTAVENVMMPLLISGAPRVEAEERAQALLAELGLAPRGSHKPGQLSGGEQQRVAVARALANDPVVLLADEPSGNLDPETSGRLHDHLFAVGAAHRTAMVLVTHDHALAARADRVLQLSAGGLHEVHL